MNVLITDAFCSSNRGDAAILDGILSGLRARLPRAGLGVVSHFPAVTRHFHGVDAVSSEDPVAVARAIGRADLVVSCGGSFLHELYALNLHPRLAALQVCARMGKPVVPFAQSFGPFDSALGRTGARNALDACAWIVARDEGSYDVVRDLGVRAPLELGVDAAVLGRPEPMPRPSAGPVLGVTARAWHFPGGGDAERYEEAMATALDAWVQLTGGTVWFLSTCTPYGGYRQDDRAAAQRIAARMTATPVIETREDLGFAQVRGQAAACDFLLGTRMHSLIFATTAGVPAFGVAYEAKTEGWMEQVGLAGEFLPIEAPDALAERLLDGWARRATSRERIAARLPDLFTAAERQLDLLAGVAEGLLPAPKPPPRVGRGVGWNEETWRYDVAHRRLRVVADAALAEGVGPVLDLGCSTGRLGRLLGPAVDYTGIDIAPSVATDGPRFRIRTGALDAPWPLDPGATFRTVLASGSLEYVDDLPAVLAQARARLAPDGVAVLTLVNLAHFARGAGLDARHPDWRLQARPDDWILALAEAGLHPVRLLASSAGYGPPPAVDREGPTDFDRDGGGQLPVERLLRLAHHVVAVCRPVAPRPGPDAVARLIEAGALVEGARIAADLVKQYPWAARAWADLGVCMHLAGRPEEAARYLERAARIDPARPDVRENLEALGVPLPADDAESAVLARPEDPEAWDRLVNELWSRGRTNSARAVKAMAELRRRVAA